MTRSWRGASALLIGAFAALLTLPACVPAGGDSYSLDGVTLRPLPAVYSTARAVSYSGYRAGQSPNTQTYPTTTQIAEDLALLQARGFGLLRLFDSSTHGQRVLQVLRAHPEFTMKVQLGVWIAGPAATKDAENQAEIARAVTLAQTYSDLVVALSVGNETLVDWSGLQVPPTDLQAYIQSVRSQVTQPVGTDDNWEPFAFGQKGNGAPYTTLVVARAVDFLSIHTYPYADTPYKLWDWKQLSVPEGPARAVAMMDEALASAQRDIAAVQRALKAKGLSTPVIIGETGWKDVGLKYRAHPVNAKMYWDRITDWVYGDGKTADSPVACFYFEAFDEPWKQGDDHWGLFAVDRSPKYVLTGVGYTEADALWAPNPPPSVPVATAFYQLFSDQTLADTTVDPDWQWNAWENGTTAEGVYTEAGDSPDTGGMLTFTPKPLSWGWGETATKEEPVDLSEFENGHLKFWIKTSYPGALEFGFSTGDPADNAAVDVYLKVSPGQYGYQNDGTWRAVSIPIADITPHAAPGYEQDANAELDLTRVFVPFVMADRYAQTGNTAGATQSIGIDGITWSRD